MLVHWRVVILNGGVDDRVFSNVNVWLPASRMSFVKIVVSNESFLLLDFLGFHVH